VITENTITKIKLEIMRMEGKKEMLDSLMKIKTRKAWKAVDRHRDRKVLDIEWI